MLPRLRGRRRLLILCVCVCARARVCTYLCVVLACARTRSRACMLSQGCSQYPSNLVVPVDTVVDASKPVLPQRRAPPTGGDCAGLREAALPTAHAGSHRRTVCTRVTRELPAVSCPARACSTFQPAAQGRLGVGLPLSSSSSYYDAYHV